MHGNFLKLDFFLFLKFFAIYEKKKLTSSLACLLFSLLSYLFILLPDIPNRCLVIVFFYVLIVCK